MYRFYEAPVTFQQALELKAQHGATGRIIAGGTDLLLEIERGVRPAPDGGAVGLIDLTRVPGLADIREENGWLHLGPLVTHNQCVASPLVVAKGFPLARACWEVGAPQIRNRATVAGNLITASPANDTIVPLLALGATVTVLSAARGPRTVRLADFFTGLRRVDLADDEVLARVSFPALSAADRGAFIKLGLRRAQAIGLVSVAAIVTADWAQPGAPVTRAAISLGAVAPQVVRATAAEASLAGRPLHEQAIAAAARLSQDAATPIDDVRASAAYRRAMVETLVARILRQIARGQERHGWPERPVLLWGERDGAHQTPANSRTAVATVNGQPIALSPGMTLLDSLRAAGFTGVKEGCAEGECGACTVFLDGAAVMACLVPAERAQGSEVTTVEGLGDLSHLHPVQAALVASGGVQCGYCTPGFVMSAAKLLAEQPYPTRGEVEEALTGNLCRCTGYHKIVDAVLLAGQLARDEQQP